MFRNYRANRGEEALPAMLPTAPSFSSSTNSTNSTNCGKWFPYKNSSDFNHNLFMVIVILVSALTGLPAINFAIRCLRRRRQPPLLPDTADQAPKPPLVLLMEATPTMAFSSELKLSGAGEECAICLSEFVSGEMLRVLPKCKHGFHEKCIEKWMVSACSCPTCRTSLLISTSPEKEVAGRSEVELPQNRVIEP